MANRTWVGTDSGNEGKWAIAANWAEAAIPVATDDVYFVSGSQDVTTGPTAVITLGSINVGTKYTGSTTATIEIDATTLDYANKQGTMVFQGTYPTVNVQSSSVDSPALTLDECTVTTLNITGGQGTVLITDGTEVSGAINIIGANSARLEIEAGADVGGADITMDDGRVVTYEEVDNVIMFGGTCEFVNSAGTTDTITMYEGTCRYKPTGETILTTLLMYGGFFDMRGCNAPTHTITNTTLYSGAIIDERNGLENCVYQNAITMGGIIKCDSGRQVTVS